MLLVVTVPTSRTRTWLLEVRGRPIYRHSFTTRITRVWSLAVLPVRDKCSSSGPLDLEVLEPVHLQGQPGRTVFHDGLEPRLDLVVRLVVAEPDRREGVPLAHGQEDAHELDLGHLHARADPRTRGPRHEAALGHRPDVGGDGRLRRPRLDGGVEDPALRAERVRVVAVGLEAAVQGHRTEVNHDPSRQKVRPEGRGNGDVLCFVDLFGDVDQRWEEAHCLELSLLAVTAPRGQHSAFSFSFGNTRVHAKRAWLCEHVCVGKEDSPSTLDSVVAGGMCRRTRDFRWACRQSPP